MAAPWYDDPTSLANPAAATFSSHRATALTSSCHVASRSLASQWTISACKLAVMFGALAYILGIFSACFNPMASSIHLSAGNLCFNR